MGVGRRRRSRSEVGGLDSAAEADGDCMVLGCCILDDTHWIGHDMMSMLIKAWI